MAGYILVADGVERRARERSEQLELDGWRTRAALGPREAVAMLPGAEVLVLGEFGGSAAIAQELLRRLRAGTVPGADRKTRVLATADSEPQIVSALSAGADMTVARNASVTLVSASVGALARRERHQPASGSMTVGPLEVDPAGRSVRFDGTPVRLTRRELDVLVLLAQQPGRVYTRDEISWEVWGGPDLRSSRSLDSHVSRMAGKFRAAGAQDVVQNVWGQGYKLNNEPGGVQR
jgi:DNA-binding response OmpR family regulator